MKIEVYDKENAVARVSYNFEPEDRYFHREYISIYDLFVSEAYRRKGNARILISAVIGIAICLGIDVITLKVYKDNTPAVELYNSCGFEIYQDHDDRYCLVKYLDRDNMAQQPITADTQN